MSKKRTDKNNAGKPDESKDHRRDPALGLRISGVLVKQIRILAKRTRRTLTAELSIAIEDHLAKHGLWPPSEEEENES